jgi:hypothetical protein
MFFKRQIAAKIEATLGTAETPAASDAGFKVNDFNLSIAGDAKERERVDGLLGWDESIPEDAHTTLTLQAPITAKGAAGAPDWSKLLRACAMALSSQTYTQSSDTSTWKSVTASGYQDGRLKKGRGIMGNGVISLAAGKAGLFDFNGMGGWTGADPADAALLTGQTFTEIVPPIFGGAGSFAISAAGGSEIAGVKISTAKIDLGNEVALREDANSDGGYLCGWVGQVKPRIELDPEAMLFATQNWYAAYRAGSKFDVSFVIGSGDDNSIEITATDLQLEKSPEDQNRNNKLVDALGFRVNGVIAIEFPTGA